MANEKCFYAKHPPVVTKQPSKVIKQPSKVIKQPSEITKQPQVISTQQEGKKVETMSNQYEAAIKNGIEVMSCGRIGTIGEVSEQLRQYLMKTPTHRGVQNVYTICNYELCPMSEEAELKGLATLAKKVMEQNPSSL